MQTISVVVKQYLSFAAEHAPHLVPLMIEKAIRAHQQLAGG